MAKKKQLPEDPLAPRLVPQIDDLVLTKYDDEPRVGEIVDNSGDGKVRAWAVNIWDVGMVIRGIRGLEVIFRPGGEKHK